MAAEVIFNGTFEEILKDSKSLTGKYLSGREKLKFQSTAANGYKV